MIKVIYFLFSLFKPARDLFTLTRFSDTHKKKPTLKYSQSMCKCLDVTTTLVFWKDSLEGEVTLLLTVLEGWHVFGKALGQNPGYRAI
jgi:hypothetical protein